MKLRVAVAVVSLAVLAAGGYAAVRLLAEPEDAIAYVPRDAFAYGSVLLRPSDEQRDAIDRFLERFPRIGTTDEAREVLTRLLDDGLDDLGLDFGRDVEPWLGHQIAGFVSRSAAGDSPAAALLVATRNRDTTAQAVLKARRGAADLAEKSYRGVDYGVAGGLASGFVGGFWVLGNEDGLKAAVDAAETDDSLADSHRYRAALADVHSDAIFVSYVDPTGLAEALRQAAPDARAAAGVEEALFVDAPFAAVVYVEPTAVVLESSLEIDDRGLGGALARSYGEAGALPSLPRDTWGAFGLARFGDLLETVLFESASLVGPGAPGFLSSAVERQTGLDLRRDVLGWMGDAAFYVAGTTKTDLGGGLFVESQDRVASKAAVLRLVATLQRIGLAVEPVDWRYVGDIQGPQYRGVTRGFAIEADLPEPLNLVPAGKKVVFAYGQFATGQALGASSYLGDTVTYREAVDGLGDGFAPYLYVDVQGLRLALESLGTVEDADYRESIEPWLERLSYVVGGTRRSGSELFVRTIVGAV